MSGRAAGTSCAGRAWACAALLVVLAGCGAPYFAMGPAGLSADREAVSGAMAALLGPASWPEEAASAAPALDAAALERAIHERVNEVRAAYGLPRLQWSGRLLPVARAHSEDMAEHTYFDHLDRSGADATQRAQRLHASIADAPGGVAENLFLTQRFTSYTTTFGADGKRVYRFEWKTAGQIAEQTVAAWMQSPAHRENVLYPRYTAQAVGVAFGGNAAVFVTQNLVSGADGRLAAR